MSSRRLSFFKNQNFAKIKDQCLKSGERFNDEYFKFTVPDVDWLRPHEICKDPRFVDDEGVSRFDVIQGSMGDCWLVVAMGNLTWNKTIFNYVVPPDQSFRENYIGMFRFRIWQCGEWLEIVVDDRLPTKDGKLIYVHSKRENEFWSALLEKAYAKLYGSYDQLVGGWFCEAMVDFTGGMVESVKLVPVPPSNLEKILFSSLEKHSFICVHMKNDPSTKENITKQGLVKGHAYSINKVQYVNVRDGLFHLFSHEKIMLIRIRNPWGRIEWNGAWSDNSPEWKSVTEEEKRNMGLVSENDGEFWMSLSDFVSHFQIIDICHVGPCLSDNLGVQSSDDNVVKSPKLGKPTTMDTTTKDTNTKDTKDKQRTQRKPDEDDEVQAKRNWEEHVFKGEWIKDVNAGGAALETVHINPQFKITLVDADDDEDDLCTLLIALMQKNKTRKIWHRIGFRAIRIDDLKTVTGALSKEYILDKLSNAYNTGFKHTRELVVRQKWPPGEYVIIPSTYNPNHEGKFLLRVFSEKRSFMEDADESGVEGSWGALLPNMKDSQAELLKQTPAVASTSQDVPRGKHLQKLVHRSDQEVRAFFNRIAGKENEIGWQGLQSLLQFALSPNMGLFTSSSDSKDIKFPKYECRTLIAMLDENRSGKLDFDEFQTLWGHMRQWESIFLECSRNSEYITAPVLKLALIRAGHRVPSSTLGSLVARHADDVGRFSFNDFVLCAVELQTSYKA